MPKEVRLTRINAAVGNLEFSPDQMMNRMENVPPYLDVFMLVQLLIWMVKEKPAKNWSRPLDWRWVRYPDLPRDVLLRLKALTAIVSDYYIAPKDCNELNQLITNLFSKKSMETSANSLDEIKRIIDEGKATSLINYTDDRKAFEDSFPLFLNFFEELYWHLLEIQDDAATKKLPIGFQLNSIEGFVQEVRNKRQYNEWVSADVFGAICGDHPGMIFYLSFKVTFHPPSVSKTFPEGLIPITLLITRSSKNFSEANSHLSLGIKSTGQIVTFHDLMKLEAVDLGGALARIDDIILNPKIWELHHLQGKWQAFYMKIKLLDCSSHGWTAD